MEVVVKLRLADSRAHQCLSTVLSSFSKETHFHHNVFFDGAASELSTNHAMLRLRFYGEDCVAARRCVLSLKAKALITDGVNRVEEYKVEEDEEEIDPFWARAIRADPNLIGSVESRILKRVRKEYGIAVQKYVCLGGFKNVRGVYEWKGLRLEVDESLFEFGTFYEVECESDEPDQAMVLIEGLLKENGVEYSYSKMSKFEIFRAGKLPEPMDLIGGGAVCGSSSDVSKPLWQYVTKLQKFGGGGNIAFRCNFCQGNYKGSYSRVKAHLLKISGLGIKHCSKVTAEHLKEMRRLVAETELRMKKAFPLSCHWPSPPSGSSESSSEKKAIVTIALPEQKSYELKKRKIIEPLDSKAPDEPAKKHLDREIARMFYSAGLSFSLAENPYFRSAFTFATENNIANYVPPACSDLEKKLLKEEKADLDRWFEPVKILERQKGASIVCSGWTYPQQSHVNFMSVAQHPVFLKAVHCGAVHKDKMFISNLIKKVILEVGPSNVVQVITENTHVCKEAGLLIEEAYPQVFWTPCVSHTLHTALERICYPKNGKENTAGYTEFSWIAEVVDCVKMIKDFILNHTSGISLFIDTPDFKELDLLETRHGYVVVLLKTLILKKDELQSMVMNEKWSLFGGDAMGDAQLVKEKLLNDIFWGKIRYILSFTEPIYDMMKIVNAGRHCLHLMFEMWGSMIAKVKAAVYYHELKEANEESIFWNVLDQILQDAWTRSKNPIYGLAYSLNPRYSCKQWLSEDPSRLPPHKDPEISSMRNVCLERYFPDEEDRQRVNLELVKFIENEGAFSEADSFQHKLKLDALTWWINFGAATPLLQNLALRLVCQPCSSWCSDPNWGPRSFGLKVKDQTFTQQDEDVLFVHMNLKSRIIRKMTRERETWEDPYGNSFDSDSSA